MLIPNHANADATAAQPSSAQIRQALRRLGVVGSVLYVAAHPDDENTNLLAYLANAKLLRTAYLSLTRGDGGQNLIGSEQGTDLGVIRTQELLAARRIDGAEQMFTRARDFGYSKNPEETLRIWGKEAVLADVVLAIRRFRPDVIITRFSPEPAETHGHHTASAQLALEAFRAAADPTFQPQQLGGDIAPWQARRIYWNRSAWSIKPGEDLSAFTPMDVNGYDPLLGLSYGEMAAESRSMHKSQGFGVARTRAPVIEYFHLLASAPPLADAKTPVLDGLDFTWKRVPGSASLRRLIARAEHDFDDMRPEGTIPTLVQIDKALAAIPDVAWREQKRAEVRALIVACAGLHAEATANQDHVVPGDRLDVTVSVRNRSSAAMRVREVRFTGATLADGGATIAVAQPAGFVEVKRQLRAATDLPLSTPHWLALPPGPGLFRIADARAVNAPTTEPRLQAEVVLEVDGLVFSVRRPLVHKWTDPVAGEEARLVEVVPLVSVRPDRPTLILPNGQPASISVHVSAPSAAVSGTVIVEAPQGWTLSPPSQSFALPGHGSEAELVFRVEPQLPPGGSAEATLHVVAKVGEARFTAFVAHIAHPHIPIQTVLHASDLHAVAFPLDRHVGPIGYLQGPGDEVAASLRQAGYDVRTLSDEHLAPAALHGLDAVVLGVRAFNTSERLRAALPVLLGYVQEGGTLVVQYNTNNRLAPLSLAIGPYPFEIGSERVTDEEAAVTFTAPTHRLLTWPNAIGPGDFAGWVQERGLYFAKTWDARYETVLRMGDAGERALDGAVLFARHGKGVFIYTGLSFFRQLPVGVPGAFRLFANLLAAAEAQRGP